MTSDDLAGRKPSALLASLVLFALCATAAFFALPHTAEAAVTFDAVGPNSGGTSCESCNNLQWSHTVSGSNTLLVVGVAAGSFDPSDITSVTFNGDALTSAGIEHPGGGDAFIELFYLVAPDSGTFTVEVQVSPSIESITGGSVSFNGVDQVTPVQNVATNLGSSANPTLNVTSAVGNMAVAVLGSGETITADSQTNRWLRNNIGTTQVNSAAQSTAAGASSVSFGYTTGGIGGAGGGRSHRTHN